MEIYRQIEFINIDNGCNLPFLESSHVIQNVELLPPLGKVNVTVWKCVWIANVHKRQILENQTTVERDKINMSTCLNELSLAMFESLKV